MKSQLQRGLGVPEVTSLLVGGIIGTSIFLVPSVVAREVNSPGLALVVWLLSGILATCGALCFAELSAAIPETGGTFVFLKRAYGNSPIAFLFGWTMVFGISTGSIAVVGAMVAIYSDHFLSPFIPYHAWEKRGVAVAVILAMVSINYLGVRVSGRTQTMLTVLKVGMIVGLIILCLAFGNGDWSRVGPLMPSGKSGFDILSSVGTAMMMSLFSFSGWYFSSHVAGETRQPSRTLPLSLMIAMSIVVVVYLSINLVYIYILPFGELRASQRVGADTMQAAFGPIGATLISAAVIVSAIGTLNAQLLNYPRIVFALAGDGLFPRAFSVVHSTRKTPANAILIVGFFAVLLSLTGSYERILSYFGFVSQLFIALGVASLIVLRVREPDLQRPYRVWGYPFTPVLYLIIVSWYLINLLATRFWLSMIGVSIMLAGLPFYYYWRKVPPRRVDRESSPVGDLKEG